MSETPEHARSRPVTITLPAGLVASSRARAQELGLSLSRYLALVAALEQGIKPLQIPVLPKVER